MARPLRVRVQATDPEGVEIAVSVVLTVPSEAVFSVREIRVLPDRVTPRPLKTVDVQMTDPAGLTALIVIVDVRVDVSITVVVTKALPFGATIISLSGPPKNWTCISPGPSVRAWIGIPAGPRRPLALAIAASIVIVNAIL